MIPLLWQCVLLSGIIVCTCKGLIRISHMDGYHQGYGDAHRELLEVVE